MIAPGSSESDIVAANGTGAPLPAVALIRYGVVPEVARFQVEPSVGIQRGHLVVVESHRGLQVGRVLDVLRPAYAGEVPEAQVVRTALPEDEQVVHEQRYRARAELRLWEERISDWRLDLQLIDLEWTLDGAKLVLYVLNERGPDCTRLALQAAAAGLGIIEVQPVSADGPVTLPSSGGGGGCGSGGGGCGCST